MLWYSIHNFLNLFENVIQNKTRNFITFLLGVVLYTLFYSYFGTYGPEYPFLSQFLKYAMYIILADGFVMAIIYKNFYNQTILTEVNETFLKEPPTNKVKYTNTNTNKKEKQEKQEEKQKEKPIIFELDKTEDNNLDEYNYSSDSALGDAYTTNGNANN